MSLLDWDTALWIPFIACGSLRWSFWTRTRKRIFHRGKHDTAESTNYVIYHSVLWIENATFGGKCKGTHHRLYISQSYIRVCKQTKREKDSSQFLMGLHLDAMAVRKRDLECLLLLQHTPEWRTTGRNSFTGEPGAASTQQCSQSSTLVPRDFKAETFIITATMHGHLCQKIKYLLNNITSSLYRS